MPLRIIFATIALLATSPARAATLTWGSGGAGGTGNWNTTTSNWYDGATDVPWSNATPDSAVFAGTAGTVTLTEAISVGDLSFSASGYTVTSNTLTLANSSGTAAVTAGVNATISSILDGSNVLAKSGAGTLTLSSANTYSGGTLVTAGRIVLGNNTALGSGTVTLDGGGIERNVAGATVANAIAVGTSGGTIVGRTTVDNYVTLSGQLTGSGSLTIQGLVLLSNATNTYSGVLTISNATTSYLRLSASEVLGDTVTIVGGGGNSFLRLDGGVTETIGELNGSGQIFGSGAGTARLKSGGGVYGGQIVNNDSTFIVEKVGSGTMTLNRGGGNGQAIGAVEVSGGRLKIEGSGVGFDSGYFTGSQSFTVRPGGTLEFNGDWNTKNTNVFTVDGGTLLMTNGLTYINNLTLQNGGTYAGNGVRIGYFGNATITVSGSSASTITTNLLLTRDSANPSYTTTLNVADVNGSAAPDLVISGAVNDNTGFSGMPLIKSGAGTVSLTAANSYTGPSTIAAGGVSIANASALGSGGLTLASAATGTNNVSLLLENVMTFSKAFTVANNGSGTVTIGTTDFTAAGNTELTGQITLGRSVTLQAGSTDRTTFSGQITGTGNVTISSPFAADRRIVFDRPSGAANNFVGDVTIGAGGRLQLGVANSIGNRTLPDTATIYFTDSNSALRPAPTGSGDSETVGTLVSSTAGAGRVDMFTGTTFTLKIGGDDESGTFSGTVLNSAGALSIEKVGSGVQTLAGNNTYGGSTTVTSGTLVVGNGAGSGAIGGGAVTVSSGATLTVNRGAYGQVWANNFSGAGTLRILGGQDPQFSGDNSSFTGPVIIDGADAQFRTRSANAWSGQSVVTIANGGMASVYSYVNTFDIKAGSLWGDGTVRLGSSNDNDLYLGGNNLDATFSGTIVNDVSGSGAVIKNGTGNQVLTGANSYSGGTTINGGRLTAGHASALGTSGAITINSGGTLGIADGVTFSRPLTINAGGKVFTGNNSTVALPAAAALSAWESENAAGDQTYASILSGSGATVPSALTTAWTSNPDTSLYLSDILTLEGTGTGNVFVLSMTYSSIFGDMNIWYREDGSSPFAPLGTIPVGEQAWNSSFTTVGQYGLDTTAGTVWVVTDHNSQFVVVPEPGTLALAGLGLAAAGLAAARRRRRRR